MFSSSGRKIEEHTMSYPPRIAQSERWEENGMVVCGEVGVVGGEVRMELIFDSDDRGTNRRIRLWSPLGYCVSHIH